MSRQYLTGCSVLLPDETLNDASVLIEDDRIAAICPSSAEGNYQEWDLEGCFLSPGMIDLHSDAIESFAEPRSGIYLPFDLAVRQSDQVAAVNGITTLFNAVSFAGEELGLRKGDAPARLVRAVNDFSGEALTHQLVHCRYEVTVEEALPKILGFIDQNLCHFVSYMDHSPGQGQFKDEANYRNYMTARYGYDDEAVTKLLEAKSAESVNPSNIQSRIQKLSDAAVAKHIPFAGHDADSRAHVEEMLGFGAKLAEFPMSLEAAEAAVERGLHQSVGAVNVIRGGSQRTGMSALDLISKGLANCLCSDYVPATLLPAVVKISEALSRPLHTIMQLVTRNPARAAGLEDRGEIREGGLADLVAFAHVRDRKQTEATSTPRIRTTWCRGRVAFCIQG